MHKALYQGSFAVAAQLLAAGGSLEVADNQVQREKGVTLCAEAGGEAGCC